MMAGRGCCCVSGRVGRSSRAPASRSSAISCATSLVGLPSASERREDLLERFGDAPDHRHRLFALIAAGRKFGCDIHQPAGIDDVVGRIENAALSQPARVAVVGQAGCSPSRRRPSPGSQGWWLVPKCTPPSAHGARISASAASDRLGRRRPRRRVRPGAAPQRSASISETTRPAPPLWKAFRQGRSRRRRGPERRRVLPDRSVAPDRDARTPPSRPRKTPSAVTGDGLPEPPRGGAGYIRRPVAQEVGIGESHADVFGGDIVSRRATRSISA